MVELKHEHDPYRARHSRSLWESRRGERESAQPVPDYSALLDEWASEWGENEWTDLDPQVREDAEQVRYLAQWRDAQKQRDGCALLVIAAAGVAMGLLLALGGMA